MEVVTYSLICAEDLDIGLGTRNIRLQDQALHALHQINLQALLIPRTVRTTPGAGTSVVQLSILPRGAWVAGVTTEIITRFGTSQGMNSFTVGDADITDRWGTQTNLNRGAQTSASDFGAFLWPVYPSGGNVEIRPTPGLFDGTGQLEVTAWYFALTHRSAGSIGNQQASNAVATSYVEAFVSQTTITILGTTHRLETADMTVSVYDDSSPAALLSPGSVTIDSTTYDVVVTFAFAQSGRIVLLT